MTTTCDLWATRGPREAALAAGHAVVATGRDAARVAAAVGDHANLLAVALDVTRAQDAQAAVEAAQARAHHELSTSLAYEDA